MITRREKEDALINRFAKDVTERLASYKKKVKSMVDGALEREYGLIVLGKQPKVDRETKKKFDYK